MDRGDLFLGRRFNSEYIGFLTVAVIFAPSGQYFIYIASQAKLSIEAGQTAALIDIVEGCSGLRP